MMNISLMLLALAATIFAQQAPAPLVSVSSDVIENTDDDLDLLTIGLPEFADLEELTDDKEADESDEDEVVDDDDDTPSTIGQRNQWRRKAQRRRQRLERMRKMQERGNSGHRRRWRQQQVIDDITPGDDDGARRQRRPHRQRHRHSTGGRGKHHRRHHHRFNVTEANHWTQATMEEKVTHVCSRLSRHAHFIQRVEQREETRPGLNDRRSYRMDFLARMNACCALDDRVRCFIGLRVERLNRFCDEGMPWKPWKPGMPRRINNLKEQCCQLQGEARSECFSIAFREWHSYLHNQTIETVGQAQLEDENTSVYGDRDDDNDDDDVPVEVMMADDPAVGDVKDDDGDGISDDEEDAEILNSDKMSYKRRKSMQRKRQRKNKDKKKSKQTKGKANRKLRIVKKKCCKAGHLQGRSIMLAATTGCDNATDIFLAKIRFKSICRTAYQKCCLIASTRKDGKME